MTEREITWLDVGKKRNVPHELVNKQIVSYPIEKEVTRNGKKVVERVMYSFTVCTARRIEK